MHTKNKSLLQTNTRRLFLKNAIGAGGIVSTSFFSTSVLSRSLPTENHSDNASKADPSKFSKLAPDFVYLNSGTEGSMPSCVIENLSNNLSRWASDPTTSYETDKHLGKRQHYQRTQVAKLFAVDKDNICLTDNTTMGLNMVLMGLNFETKDKVILTNHEHNAIVSPLTVHQQRIGLKLIKRPFPSAAILNKMNTQELIDFLLPNSDELRGAKALCVSHVYPSTGVRLPLKALRKKADQLAIKYLIIDGAQAFGMIDITQGDDDIKHADFYACPGHKWLNGPPSTGILYIKHSNIQPPEFYPILSQRMTKYIDNSRSFPMAQALQVRGCSNTPGFSAMLAAIDFQNQIGGAKLIESQIMMMSEKIKKFINSHSDTALVSPDNDPRLSSGLTVFFPFKWQQPDKLFSDKKTADHVVNELLKKNIQIRSIGFYNSNNAKNGSYALRVSTAVFNTDAHIYQFEQALQDVLINL